MRGVLKEFKKIHKISSQEFNPKNLRRISNEMNLERIINNCQSYFIGHR